MNSYIAKADDITGPVTPEIVPEEPESVYIRWDEPKAPNGVIILYEVNYKRISDNDVSTSPDGGHYG